MVRFDGAEVGKVYRLKPNEINLGSASREWFDAEIMVLGKGSGYIKVRYKLLTGRSDRWVCFLVLV